MNPSTSHDFEQRMLNLIKQGSNSNPDQPFIVQLEIKEVNMSWLLKVRKQNIIVNNQDLVFRSIVVDHSISFDTYESFMNAVEAPDLGDYATDHSKSVTFSGDMTAIAPILSLLRLPFLHSHPPSRPPSPARSMSNNSMTQSAVNSHSNAQSKGNRKLNVHTDHSPPSPIPRKPKCLHSGWLFKKRDVLSGWTHRFFRVYAGRVEYFVDEAAVVPKGVIPLLGAYIVGCEAPPQATVVKGTADHFQLIIEPRHRDKAYILASEDTGKRGLRHISKWIEVLYKAARSPEMKAIEKSGRARSVGVSLLPDDTSQWQEESERKEEHEDAAERWVALDEACEETAAVHVGGEERAPAARGLGLGGEGQLFILGALFVLGVSVGVSLIVALYDGQYGGVVSRCYDQYDSFVSAVVLRIQAMYSS